MAKRADSQLLPSVKFISLTDAAKQYGVTIGTMRSWFERYSGKIIPRLTPGGKRFLLRSDVEHIFNAIAPRFSSCEDRSAPHMQSGLASFDGGHPMANESPEIKQNVSRLVSSATSKYIAITDAAKLYGIDVRTLARYIERHCHKTVPRLGPGAKRFVLVSDVEHAITMRSARFSRL